MTSKKTTKEAGVDQSVLLHDTPFDKEFVCVDQKRFKNLGELAQECGKLSEDIFSYHVNEQKNDFATWIYDCIGDVTLANSIRELKDQKKISRKIKLRVTALKKKRA